MSVRTLFVAGAAGTKVRVGTGLGVVTSRTVSTTGVSACAVVAGPLSRMLHAAMPPPTRTTAAAHAVASIHHLGVRRLTTGPTPDARGK
jgi:hypothetical protein